jgi:HAD superfamily hydrolase (TIGR01662 family)
VSQAKLAEASGTGSTPGVEQRAVASIDRAVVHAVAGDVDEGCLPATRAAAVLEQASYATARERLVEFRAVVPDPRHSAVRVRDEHLRRHDEEQGLPRIRTVVFDVGEVLVDESTEYGTWADWLGVPRHTFSAMFGAVIARGQDYRQVFQHFQPGFDLATERKKRLEAGLGEFFNARDLYPDVRPCLEALRAEGYTVGIAGNQTARAGVLIRELNLPADFISTSDDLGAEKPDVAFFEQLLSRHSLTAKATTYVGDRFENDILPAQAAGLTGVLLKRGPWGFVNDTHPDAAQAAARLDSLDELLAAIRNL